MLQVAATATAAATGRAERSAQGLPGCVSVLLPSKAKGEEMVRAGALLSFGKSRRASLPGTNAAGRRRCWASS